MWEIESGVLTTLFALSGLYLLLGCKRLFFVGFFVGLLWFWWIGLSFRYYHLTPLVPFASLAIALFYGLLFKLVEMTARQLARLHPLLYQTTLAAALWGASYLHPFGFNWFIPEIIFVDSLFGYDKLRFALILTALVLLHFKRVWSVALAVLLLAASVHTYPRSPLAPLRIKLVTTQLDQERKWQPSQLPSIVQANLAAIDSAIEEGYEMVVLPESAFPTFLQHDTPLMLELLQKSHHIAIVTGALHTQDSRVYNATYVFDKGRYTILHKVVLVPFGEYVPLPAPLARLVNHYFFDDATDFSPAKEPQIYKIAGQAFTNAICYEATSPIIYTTPTTYIVAISNNAWFVPSYEPQLQNRIIRYYATIHHKTVYHATNIAQTKVIR